MEDESLVAKTYAEMNPLTLPEQLRLAIDLLDSSPPLPDGYLKLLVNAIGQRGIDSPVVITTVLMLRIALQKSAEA